MEEDDWKNLTTLKLRSHMNTAEHEASLHDWQRDSTAWATGERCLKLCKQLNELDDMELEPNDGFPRPLPCRFRAT